MSNSTNTKSLNNLKSICKNKFKKLAVIAHPDTGGDESLFIKFKNANDVIQDASIKDFIKALDDAEKHGRQYFKPGSLECVKCVRWSDITGLCIAINCIGFKSYSPKINFNTKSKVSTVSISC